MSTQTRNAPPIEETVKMARAAALFANGFRLPTSLGAKPIKRVALNG